MTRRDTGSASLWLLGLTLLPLTASGLSAAEAFARIIRHRAESAADLAALAAAGPGGCPAARLTANASEVLLVACSARSDGTVVVTVRAHAGPFGAVDASARAGVVGPVGDVASSHARHSPQPGSLAQTSDQQRTSDEQSTKERG